MQLFRDSRGQNVNKLKIDEGALYFLSVGLVNSLLHKLNGDGVDEIFVRGQWEGE